MNTVILIGQLLKTVGAVEGRKKFQKIVHILQHFGAPFNLRFGYLHYGPFSSELQSQLDVYESEDLLKEEPSTAGSFRTSRFTPQPKLMALVDRVAGNAPFEFAGLAGELNQKSAQELEAISTIFYLQTQGKTDAALKEAFCQLKPKFASVYEERLRAAEAMRASQQAA